MRVKVGDKIYSGKEQPVMVILSETDKRNISLMPVGANRYCEYPDDSDLNEVEWWMDEGCDEAALG